MKRKMQKMNSLDPYNRIRLPPPAQWPQAAIARPERPPRTATGPRVGLNGKPDLTHQNAEAHVNFVAPLQQPLQQTKAKRTKPHDCIPPPPPPQPLPVVPSGLKRQPAAEHGGLTIEAMTTAVIAALDKHHYTYELPRAYSAFRPFDTITVPECSFQPRHPNDYSVPQITFTEAYKATTMMSPSEKNTTPATIVWYGYRRDVKTIEEIANHIDQCHAKFESDRHANWEIVAEKTINAHIGEFIGQIMSKAAHTFQDKAASRKRIFDKVHDAAVKALKSEVPSHH